MTEVNDDEYEIPVIDKSRGEVQIKIAEAINLFQKTQNTVCECSSAERSISSF